MATTRITTKRTGPSEIFMFVTSVLMLPIAYNSSYSDCDRSCFTTNVYNILTMYLSPHTLSLSRTYRACAQTHTTRNRHKTLVIFFLKFVIYFSRPLNSVYSRSNKMTRYDYFYGFVSLSSIKITLRFSIATEIYEQSRVIP